MKMATITVTMNIATGNKYEGNAEFRLNIPESELQDNPKKTWRKMSAMFTEVAEKATANYYIKNAEESEMNYTTAELKDAFDKVADPNDWKAGIYKRVWLKKLDVTVAAIKFFTGTDPKVERFNGRDDATVTSEGYRAGPCGDH